MRNGHILIKSKLPVEITFFHHLELKIINYAKLINGSFQKTSILDLLPPVTPTEDPFQYPKAKKIYVGFLFLLVKT
jgi:hypothetical protein